ncbi:DnaJ domain-containing protein [Pseudomonas pohangensis]|uniref:DnaJ domain-containing protein n=1 Tax=Pseudomonas pohangensis TaxID=364197 RepID=A0A1H2ET82_9PSED|nr:DnaJ domain-containing protein [Pseudomonas pohangensis]
MRTHYENLQITETAGAEVIRAAYKVLAQKWHPDKNLEQSAKADRNFKIITSSFEVLSDPVLRKKYDDSLSAKRSAEAVDKAPESAPEAPTMTPSDKPTEVRSRTLRKPLWAFGAIVLVVVLITSIFLTGPIKTTSTHSQAETSIYPIAPPMPVSTSVAVPAAVSIAPAPAPVIPPAAVKTGPVVAGPGEGLLSISFTNICWTQVSDADGKVLFNGLKRPGESLLVAAKLPLEVRLGYTPGAQVAFNGYPVDTKPFATGETARLKLGQ